MLRGVKKVIHRVGEADAFGTHNVNDSIGVLDDRLVNLQFAGGIAQGTLDKFIISAPDCLGLGTRTKAEHAFLYRKALPYLELPSAIAGRIDVGNIVTGRGQGLPVSINCTAADGEDINHLSAPSATAQRRAIDKRSPPSPCGLLPDRRDSQAAVPTSW